VLEKIVHEQVCENVEQNEILSPVQSGFRKHHSTITALLKVTNDINMAMDCGKMTVLSLLDLSKAFDCVHTELLLVKLKMLGFSSSAAKWFESYLSERIIRVKADENFLSDWTSILAGVPQGSVLGPLLFVLYLFDLPHVVKYCNIHMYADDVQLYVHSTPANINEAIRLLSLDIDNVINYFQNHNLILNVEKTQAIIIGYGQNLKNVYSNHSPSLVINDKNIPFMKTVKNLGVIFDETLSWGPQTIALVKNVFGTLAQLRRNVDFMPMHIRKLLINALVFSRIDYSVPLLTDGFQYNIDKLQRAQNAAVRFISYIARHHHITPLYLSLRILKIEQRIKLKVSVYIWKIMKTQRPVYLYNLFINLTNLNKRSTRLCSSIITIPTHRTSKYKKSFVVTACRAYNDLKIYDLLNLSFVTFKKKLISFMLQSPSE